MHEIFIKMFPIKRTMHMTWFAVMSLYTFIVIQSFPIKPIVINTAMIGNDPSVTPLPGPRNNPPM